MDTGTAGERGLSMAGDYRTTGVAYEMMRLAEIRDPVLDGPGHGPMEVGIDTYRRLAGRLEAAGAALRTTLYMVQASHEGPAAEAGQRHIMDLITPGDLGAAESKLAAMALEDQATYHVRARNDMAALIPPEVPERLRGFAPRPPAEGEEARRVQAVDAASLYQDNSNHNLGSGFQAFLPPRGTEVGLAPGALPAGPGGAGAGGVGIGAAGAGGFGGAAVAPGGPGGPAGLGAGGAGPAVGGPGVGGSGAGGPGVGGVGGGGPGAGGVAGSVPAGAGSVPGPTAGDAARPGGRSRPLPADSHGLTGARPGTDGSAVPGTRGPTGSPGTAPQAAGRVAGPIGARGGARVDPRDGILAGAPTVPVTDPVIGGTPWSGGGSAGPGGRVPSGGTGWGRSVEAGAGAGWGAPSGGGGPRGVGDGGSAGGSGQRPPQGAPAETGRASGPPRTPGADGYGHLPMMPMTGGAGGREGAHPRPSWLLEDDPEALWFAGLPPHTDPVIKAEQG